MGRDKHKTFCNIQMVDTIIIMPSQLGTLAHCLFNVGPASATVDPTLNKHWANVPCVCWVCCHAGHISKHKMRFMMYSKTEILIIPGCSRPTFSHVFHCQNTTIRKNVFKPTCLELFTFSGTNKMHCILPVCIISHPIRSIAKNKHVSPPYLFI